MTRRDMLARSGAYLAGACALRGASEPDLHLNIAPVTLELAPKKTVKTLAYNGQVPGPLLRFPQGKTITVEISNDTAEPEILHWHGFHIPPEVDGAHEEGTPHVPAHGSQRYTFAIEPAGTRWYHSHNMAGHNFQKGPYTGQFGMFIVDPREDPARYDVEVPILLHDWMPFLGNDDVEYKLYSVNGKMLGAGEPVRVKEGQRALFRILNASATLMHRVALTGHRFQVIALDGNPVPAPKLVPMLELGPGERVDAVVQMSNPGVWVLGELDNEQRSGGLGIVVEYADRKGDPRWLPPPPFTWDYTSFGGNAAAPEPDGKFPMEFREHSQHHWTINGKSWPQTDRLNVRAGKRYRMLFDNQSALAHPLHLHRHTFEITRYLGKPTSGVMKDVVVVPAWKQVEIDVPTNQPGLSLFHCHQQFHMDMGLMTLMVYVD
jgi:FtsP/CotA-like multicopper oxidase with cupredoxin domain